MKTFLIYKNDYIYKINIKTNCTDKMKAFRHDILVEMKH